MKNHYDAKRFRKEGNGQAASPKFFEAFVREEMKDAYRIAQGMCGDAEEAEELIQEASYRVLRSWNRYDSRRPLRHWFLSVMRNVHLDWKARDARWGRVSIDSPIQGCQGDCYADILRDNESIGRNMEREEAAKAVRQAIAGLDETYRGVMKLCHLDGMTYDEIAKQLSVPIGTVRSRISTGRELLRNQPHLAAVA